MGLKKNLAYSTIQTVSTYLVPVLVFPLISRVLGPSYIGQIDTVESIIDFCILFSMMGLTTLGVREIAKSRNNHAELEQVFSDLFIINIISTTIVITILIILSLVVPFMIEHRKLMLIGMLKIMANMFWVEWFFKGIENFKYITIRSVLVRLLFIVAVYLFINTREDYILYYFLWVSVYLMNAICNWLFKRRYIRFRLKSVSIKRYLKPFIIIGVFSMLSAVYTQLNAPILRFICGQDDQVAYYTISVRIYRVLIAMFSTLTAVMIPHVSVMVKEGAFDEIRILIDKTFTLLFFFSIPAIVFTAFFAPDIIRVISGPGYGEAAFPMRIVMFMLLIAGTEQIFILQLLIPAGKDKSIMFAGICGVFVFTIMSSLLVKPLQSIGSALCWVFSELTVLTVSSISVKRFYSISFPWKLFIKLSKAIIPYSIIGILFFSLTENFWIRVFGGFAAFVACGIILEAKIYKLGYIKMIINKIRGY